MKAAVHRLHPCHWISGRRSHTAVCNRCLPWCSTCPAVRHLSGIRRRTLLCRRFRQCFQYMARSDLHRNRSVRIRVPALFRRCLHRFPPLQRQPFHVWQTETGSAVFAGAKIRHVFKKPYMIAHVRLLRKQISQRGLRESRFSSGMHTPPHRFPRIATGK